MQLSILAFLMGVVLVKMQAALLGAGVYGGLATLALGRLVSSGQGAPWLFRAGSLLRCVMICLVWAGWLAQQRLADQLPAASESREMVLSGVVASLPQRSEFDVEARLAALADMLLAGFEVPAQRTHGC